MTQKVMQRIIVLARTPGADTAAAETAEWTSFCHDKGNPIIVWHDPFVERGRWIRSPRKRPFAVSYRRLFSEPVSRHVTLDAAMKVARKLAKDVS